MSEFTTPILFLATTNAAQSRSFYEGVLGLKFIADEPAALVFQVGHSMLRIQKVNQVQTAPYTALGWHVGDIGRTINLLGEAGVQFERYEGMNQDANGIWQSPSGSLVAWFRDPDGHVLSLTQFGH